MESNGRPGCIHVSQVTADILKSMGKTHWVEARDEKVHCKGKGDLQTYFVSVSGVAKSVVSSATPDSEISTDEDMFDVEVAVANLEGAQTETEDERLDWVEKNYRRIGWVRDLLQEQLEKVAGQRGKEKGDPRIWGIKSSVTSTGFSWSKNVTHALLSSGDGMSKELSDDLSREILEFVSQVAYSHPRVPYHNFDQTCCVLTSVDRMLKQISTVFGSEPKPSPLANLACLFSALIRNLSPPSPPTVGRQKGEGFVLFHQSAAEVRSADAALQLLKSDRFGGLREVLCANSKEFQSFWGMVQNLILATDISGGVLSEERDKRWNLSFGSSAGAPGQDAKVLSILEHVILVAEEGYAAQHWENYLKWSTLLLNEYREMYEKGEMHDDPDGFWDHSRLDYFDSFVLPLAEKVNDAGILGNMGGEFYNFATQNRRELETAEGIASMRESSRGSMIPLPPRLRSEASKRRWWSLLNPDLGTQAEATAAEMRDARSSRKPAPPEEARQIVFEEAFSDEDSYVHIVEV
jgi:3'5'-cyclic nucleotide phosphodiesterase